MRVDCWRFFTIGLINFEASFQSLEKKKKLLNQRDLPLPRLGDAQMLFYFFVKICTFKLRVFLFLKNSYRKGESLILRN
jgi:hypothetical protein